MEMNLDVVDDVHVNMNVKNKQKQNENMNPFLHFINSAMVA